MILPIIFFVFISVVSWSISRLMKQLILDRKNRSYFHNMTSSTALKSRRELGSGFFAKIEDYLKKNKVGKHFFKIQQQYDLNEEIKLVQVLFVLFGTIGISWNLSGLINVSAIPLILSALSIEGVAVFFLLRKRRLAQQLEAEFPKILDSVASVYHVTPDLKQSFEMSERLTHQKVSLRFLKELNQIARVGVPITQALEMVARTWVFAPLLFFISAIKLHQRSGGDLAQLFHHTANSLRRQQQNKKAMDTVMFQNKVSAVIVCSLVPIIFIFSVFLSPNYRSVITGEPTARALVVGASLWWIIGVVVMMRTLRVRV